MTMAYRKTLGLDGRLSDVVRRDIDGTFIPADPQNRDRQSYQAWLEAGHAPAEPGAPVGSEPPPEPDSSQA